jgi:hypothetical protein
MARLRCLFRIRLAVARSSMASWLWVLANWLETRCREFWRMLAMRACSRTSRLTALARLREPRLARETACVRRCTRLSRRASGRGAWNRATSRPSAVAATAKAAIPRSIPTKPLPQPVEGGWWRRSAWKSGASTLRLISQRLPCRATVANRSLARGARAGDPVNGRWCSTGRRSRRSRLVSSCTRTTPIVGRSMVLALPSPIRI